MHDGSKIVLNKLERDYDPTDRAEAIRILEEANRCNCLITGLIYIDPYQTSLQDKYNLTETPLNRLKEDRIRPPRESIQKVNELMF
jgi:2-oxoglutarate ferredoxin oxidoreductase subunit beta